MYQIQGKLTDFQSKPVCGDDCQLQNNSVN